MKNKLLVGFLISVLFSCSKRTTYQATYTTISMAKMNPTDSLKLEDWISVDTNNIYSNGRLVVVEKMLCYTDGKSAYFDNRFVKSGQGSTAADESLRHIFLDYENRIVYFLDDKRAFSCAFGDDVVFTDEFNSRVFVRVLKKNNSEVRLTFDREVPKEIRGKYLNTKNEYGITQILSPSQKMNLTDYRIATNFNLDSIKQIAKKQCVLNSGAKIDLLFPKAN